MRIYFYPLVYVFVICTACWQCKTTKTHGKVELSKSATLFIADSTKAASLIINDDTDHYFTQVTEADMCIQMHKNYPAETFRSQMLNDYIDFLQKDVNNFSSDESSFVESTMQSIYNLCEKLSPDIFPKNLYILKTKGKHYGDGVYYTRENCIIVPADVLKKRDKDEFFSTMIHEVFHVYSRLHPEKRKALYDLIGFRKLETGLNISEPLKSRILLNPDGTDFRYKISLQVAPDKEIQAIPIIYSSEPAYKKNKPEFFNYLKFEMFEVKANKDKMEVVCKKDGTSTLSLKELPDYWRQIRDNTQYIIHPDEILADNFMFLVKSLKNKDVTEKFSPEGKTLIEDIKNIIVTEK